MDTFHVYLYFPEKIDDKISTKEEGEKFIRDLQMSIDIADCEEGVTLYYGQTNKNSFFEGLNILQEEDMIGNFGGYTFEEALNILINEIGVFDWEMNPIHDINEVTCYYRRWISENREPTSDLPNILKEVTEQIFKNKNTNNVKSVLINFCSAYSSPNLIEMIRGCRNIRATFIHIESVTNFIELDNWLINNRISRNYNVNDFRHIENHPNYIRDKSPLLNGLGGIMHAAELLTNAIGDIKIHKWLINIDEQNSNHYIRFEDENSNTTYHGYHLVKPFSHNVDEDATKDIPSRVISILNYRKSIN